MCPANLDILSQGHCGLFSELQGEPGALWQLWMRIKEEILLLLDCVQSKYSLK